MWLGYTAVSKDPVEEAENMLYIGIDVHKKNLSVCVLDESWKLVKRRNVCNQRESARTTQDIYMMSLMWTIFLVF